jgi:hypothetical protein
MAMIWLPATKWAGFSKLKVAIVMVLRIDSSTPLSPQPK